MILRGWKQIAEYLDWGYRTAQRWEELGLPVRRLTKGPRSRVYAYSEQIDLWVKDGHIRRIDLKAIAQKHQDVRNGLVRLQENR